MCTKKQRGHNSPKKPHPAQAQSRGGVRPEVRSTGRQATLSAASKSVEERSTGARALHYCPRPCPSASGRRLRHLVQTTHRTERQSRLERTVSQLLALGIAPARWLVSACRSRWRGTEAGRWVGGEVRPGQPLPHVHAGAGHFIHVIQRLRRTFGDMRPFRKKMTYRTRLRASGRDCGACPGVEMHRMLFFATAKATCTSRLSPLGWRVQRETFLTHSGLARRSSPTSAARPAATGPPPPYSRWPGGPGLVPGP